MTRQAPQAPGAQLNADEFYTGVLRPGFKIEPSKNVLYPDDRLLVEWELTQGATLMDWISLRLGVSVASGQPAKLRQLLNAIAEKPIDAECWFDAETLEWGYDFAPTSAPYAKLHEGMAVKFRGIYKNDSKGQKRYRIDAYRQLDGKA